MVGDQLGTGAQIPAYKAIIQFRIGQKSQFKLLVSAAASHHIGDAIARQSRKPAIVFASHYSAIVHHNP
jgi:hypothetical protein